MLTVDGKLEEALAVRQEKVDSELLLAEMKRKLAMAEGVQFDETFEGIAREFLPRDSDHSALFYVMRIPTPTSRLSRCLNFP